MTHVNEVELFLDKSFKSVEDKERFLIETLNLQLSHGITSQEYRDYLVNKTNTDSNHTHAYYFLYLSYIYSMEIEEARKIAWKLISIESNYFSQGLLSDLENASYIFELVYRFGDRDKLPSHIIQSNEEADRELIDFINSL